jgi:hypothetical protein
MANKLNNINLEMDSNAIISVYILTKIYFMRQLI